jgi:hypothetical protein
MNVRERALRAQALLSIAAILSLLALSAASPASAALVFGLACYGGLVVLIAYGLALIGRINRYMKCAKARSTEMKDTLVRLDGRLSRIEQILQGDQKASGG